MPGTLFAPGQGPRAWERLPHDEQGTRRADVFALWTAEGGNDQATVTAANSGGASGDQFDTTQTGTDAIKRYSALYSYNGNLSIEFATGSTAQTPTVGWNTRIGAQAEIWFCLYCYFNAFPALEHRLLHVHDAAGSAQRCSLSLRPDGMLQMLDSVGSTIAGDRTTTPIALNAWNRIEFHAILDATVGKYETWLYKNNPAALVDDYDQLVSSAATKNLGGPGGTYRFGITGSSVANVRSWFADQLAVANNRIGPIGTQTYRHGTPPPRFAPGQGPRVWERFPHLRPGDLVIATGETHSGATQTAARASADSTGGKGGKGSVQSIARPVSATTGTGGRGGATQGACRPVTAATGLKGATGSTATAARAVTAAAAAKGAAGAAQTHARSQSLATGSQPSTHQGVVASHARAVTTCTGTKGAQGATQAAARSTGTSVLRKGAQGACVASSRASAIAAALHGGRGATQAHARSATALSTPPAAFTVGVLTAADVVLATLTAGASGGLAGATDTSGQDTATDQVTGRLTATDQAGGPS